MRLLCLHGQGTSADIFESQTAAFRAKLDDSYQFDFVDAPFPCAPAPGIRVVFNSGHYAWWPKQSIPLIRGAHKWLLDYVDDHGPYDALLCFSQGCALAISALLYQRHEIPTENLPFKSVIFICGGLPLPVLEDLGLLVPQKAHDINKETVKLLKETAGRLAEFAADPTCMKRGVGLWDDTDRLIHDPKVMPEESDIFGLDFNLFPKTLRVQIPTVHIYGAKDPRWPSSLQLAHFCNNRRMYDHRGGHDIPRSSAVSTHIAHLIRELNDDICIL